MGDHALAAKRGPSMAAILGPGDHLWQHNLPQMVRGDQLWRGTNCGVTLSTQSYSYIYALLWSITAWMHGACVEVATEINSGTEPYTNAKHRYHYKHEQYINKLTAITANCKFCSHAL